MEARKRLRELVDAKEILVLPGAYDALSARLAEAAGFPCVYMTGYGQSASKLGAPDVGLMTMSEMVERAKDMCAAVSVPVICDGDTGFGNVVNLVRTVREYERAGAAAIQLEDQTTPKKCGHMLGRQVVDAEEMVNKIRAAAAARQDPDFLIIARTDARTNHGVEEAIRRARLYEQAGADIIFVESLESVEEMRMVNETIAKPTIANMVETGRTPLLTAAQLQEIGYDKESGVYLFLNNIGQNLFMGFVICLLCLIHVDGEPIAEIGDVFKNGTNWQIIFAVGSVIAIGGAMAADVCGVATWLLSIFQGIFGGMSIVTVVIIVCVLSCLITQFFSNSATAILFLTALAPLAVVLYQEGINVSVFPALIGTGTLTACLLPSGSGQSAIMLSTDIFADDGQQWALSKGIVVLVAVTLAIVASGIISILVL